MKSWKTTLLGWLAFLGALLPALTAQFDSDPTTVPSWELVVTMLLAALGMTAARDNGVTSEQAGAK